jgi:hypothetical protein
MLTQRGQVQLLLDTTAAITLVEAVVRAVSQKQIEDLGDLGAAEKVGTTWLAGKVVPLQSPPLRVLQIQGAVAVERTAPPPLVRAALAS